MSSVHVLYNGRNETYDFTDVFNDRRRELLGLADGEITVGQLTEAQVKRAMSDMLDVNQNEFSDHYVELNSKTGNVTLRPNSGFGF
jgi:hypothetical protein